VKLLRGFTAVWGVTGTLLGLTMIGYRSGLDRFWEIVSIGGSGLLALFLLAASGRAIPIRALQAAALMAIVLVLIARIGYGVDALLAGAMGTVLLVGFGIACSRPAPGKQLRSKL